MSTFVPNRKMSLNARPQDFIASSPPQPERFHTAVNDQQPKPIHNGARNHSRPSADHRGAGFPAGSRAIPTGQQTTYMTDPRNRGQFGGVGGFDGPRSPPNTKNLSHVPCKFFKQGQCQAGIACPFSHNLEPTDQECKYFKQGNCKFGTKCALLHVDRNGRIVNRPQKLLAQLNLGGRVDPQTYYQQPEPAWGNSLLTQQANGTPMSFIQPIPDMPEIDIIPPSHSHTQPLGIPWADTKYGLPRDDLRLPMSPAMHATALDAKLPASFDSNGVSLFAKYADIAASVPTRFGLESPSSSLPSTSLLTSDTVRNLRESAYGGVNRNMVSQLGSSPSVVQDENVQPRMMHSQRITRPSIMSASLPRPMLRSEWDHDDQLLGEEEDRLPSDLFQSIEQRPRRFSGPGGGAGYTSAELSSKVGSPGTASPSRFTALFNEQRRREESNGLVSSFGHVGSPLRNSALFLGSSPEPRSASRSYKEEVAFGALSHSPRQPGISMLSQQLSRAHLSRPASNEGTSGLHPPAIRHTSNPRSGYDRAVSSSSANTNRIDEEPPDCVFSLDEEEPNGHKANGNVWSQPKSPDLGPIGGGRNVSGLQNGANGSESSKC